MCSWNRKSDRFGRRKGWWFIFGLPFVLLFLAVGSLVTMLLWNALLPAIFGLKAISFLQALGLLILTRILFGGFRGRPKPFYGNRRHWERWRRWHEGEQESADAEEKQA